MQTFLPMNSFEGSAKILDYRRLGKQRLEARQLLVALTTGKSQWRNHPACRMWEGYEEALARYGDVMIKEWIKRGYNNSMGIIDPSIIILPPWMGDARLHSSHRTALIRKDPVWYSQFGWEEKPDNNVPYFWPKGTFEYGIRPASRKPIW